MKIQKWGMDTPIGSIRSKIRIGVYWGGLSRRLLVVPETSQDKASIVFYLAKRKTISITSNFNSKMLILMPPSTIKVNALTQLKYLQINALNPRHLCKGFLGIQYGASTALYVAPASQVGHRGSSRTYGHLHGRREAEHGLHQSGHAFVGDGQKFGTRLWGWRWGGWVETSGGWWGMVYDHMVVGWGWLGVGVMLGLGMLKVKGKWRFGHE